MVREKSDLIQQISDKRATHKKDIFAQQSLLLTNEQEKGTLDKVEDVDEVANLRKLETELVAICIDINLLDSVRKEMEKPNPDAFEIEDIKMEERVRKAMDALSTLEKYFKIFVKEKNKVNDKIELDSIDKKEEKDVIKNK